MGRKRRRDRGKKSVDLLVTVMLLLAIYFALFGGDYSVWGLSGLKSLKTERAATLAATEARIDSLEGLARQLRHDESTIERVARERYGMIREGEILYRFREPEPADPATRPD